jgi:hypothetical protein
MYAIWAVIVFVTLTGAYALLGSETAPPVPSAAAANLASSMSVYRQAVVSFALNHPAFTGSVPVGSLSLPAGTQSSPWQNYVVPNGTVTGSLVVVYGTSSSSGSAAADVEQLAQGSALAGVALSGTVQSPGNPQVPLPAALVNSVPNGALVWMAQAYE